MIKKTYKISGMHCASCAMVIESDLEDAGVKAQCSYAKETLMVEYEETKVADHEIAAIVSQSGYQVNQ